MVFIVASFLLFHSVYADTLRKAILIGGSCEAGRPRNYNMYHNSLASQGKGLAKRGWEVSIQYGGPNERCTNFFNCSSRDPERTSVDSLLKRSGLKTSSVFMNTENELLKQLELEIKAAEAAKKDGKSYQLFLGINTHGAQEVEGKEHEICFSKPDGQNEFIPVSKLRPYLKRLKDLGAKVGVQDNSCYSGSTVKHLGDLGCVITNQSSNRVTYNGGTEYSFLELLEKDSWFDMEEVFLKGIIWNKVANYGYFHSYIHLQPMISGFVETKNPADTMTKILSPENTNIVSGTSSPSDDLTINRCEEVIQGMKNLQAFSEDILPGLKEYWMQRRLEILKGETVKAPKELVKEIQIQLKEYNDLFQEYIKLSKERNYSYQSSTVERDESGILANQIFDLWRIPFLNRIKDLKDNLNHNIALARAYDYMAQRDEKKISSECADFRF